MLYLQRENEVIKMSSATFKKRGLALFLIGVTLCFCVFLFWWFNLRSPVKGESVSPDGTYFIRVGWKETEVWPHHAPPLNIRLQGYQTEPKKKLFTLRSTVDSGNGTATMDEDIRFFWESDSHVTILLLGRYQVPEVITVDFADGPEVVRECSYSAARDLFLEHHIPLSDLVGLNIEE